MGLEWFCDVGAVLPFAGMVTETLALASKYVVMKGALSQGIDKYVLLVYSNCVSSLIFFFCSIIFHRSAASRPPLTFGMYCSFVLLSLIGFSGQICGYAGIQYSSATLAASVLNVVPAFTFILAIVFRMEKVEWRRSSSQAKVVGAIVSILGAFVVTLYKGPSLMLVNLSLTSSQQQHWILGGLLLVADAFTVSATYILEAMLLKKYPAPLLIVFYSFSSGTLLSSIYCMIMVQDSTSWRLGLDMGLVVLCLGFTTALSLGLVLWCMSKTGPLYVSMFKPLGIILAAVLSIVFLGDVLGLGSVLGSVTIVIGFYMVMWGKAKEREMESSGSFSNIVPFLQNTIEESL